MISTPARIRLRARTSIMALCALFVAGCGDRDATAPIVQAGQPPMAGAAQLTCTVTTVGIALMECRPSVGQMFVMPGKSLAPAGAKTSLLSAVTAGLIIGGQNTNIKLTSTILTSTADEVTGNVQVQNLIGQPLGTTDGTTTDPQGIRVFFSSGPTANVGTVSVDNEDGNDNFTAAAQPYFQYTTVLAQNQTTAPKLWRFALAGGATTFTFGVYVWAPVQHPDGWIELDPASATLDLTTGDVAQQLSPTLRDALGNELPDEAITWESVDTDVATVDAGGLVTAQEAGSTTITATSGARSGTAAITVVGPSLDNSTVTSQYSAIDANGTSQSIITVQLRNAANEIINTGGFTVVISTDHGTMTSTAYNGDGTYTATLTSATTAGTAAVSATIDGDAITEGVAVTFTPGGADHFAIEAAGGGPIATQVVNVPFNIRITALDVNDNVATSFNGDVYLSTQGPFSIALGVVSGFVNGESSSNTVSISGSGEDIYIVASDSFSATGMSNTFTVSPSDSGPGGPPDDSLGGSPYRLRTSPGLSRRDGRTGFIRGDHAPVVRDAGLRKRGQADGAGEPRRGRDVSAHADQPTVLHAATRY